LLESQGTATKDFYKEGEEYVEFKTWNELFEKIEYYLNNKEERVRIAENGYNKLIQNYSPRKAWERVFRAYDIIKNNKLEELISLQTL
jgi:spore maturation protein CgeB